MDRYFVARDADVIAKFLSKITAHKYKLELYKNGNGEFPRPVPKNAKWPAYEAASRIERALNLDTHAHSVPDLASVLSTAIAWLNDYSNSATGATV